MSSAFRTGGSIDESIAADGPQSVKEALENLKKAAGGLKESAGELTSEFVELLRVAKANGGKIPNVNEIARQVLDGRENKEDN